MNTTQPWDSTKIRTPSVPLLFVLQEYHRQAGLGRIIQTLEWWIKFPSISYDKQAVSVSFYHQLKSKNHSKVGLYQVLEGLHNIGWIYLNRSHYLGSLLQVMQKSASSSVPFPDELFWLGGKLVKPITSRWFPANRPELLSRTLANVSPYFQLVSEPPGDNDDLMTANVIS